MKVVSLFAGIGGFDLGFMRAGFEIVAHVEKDANCRKLLAAKWPEAIALDDVCTSGAHNLPACDVVVGGSPCQSFSVAGLRKGLNDPRGNLMLEYLRIVSEMRPQWMVWENVPGVLSDKTKALQNMLDALDELGYVVDIEIVDAQWNGLAQRRRRVFICGRSVESLATETTSTSALVIAQCLTEILHGILAGTLAASGDGPSESVLPKLSNDGLNRKIRLFKLHGETGNLCQKWRNCLDAAFLKSAQGPEGSVAGLGESQGTCTEADQRLDVEKERLTTLTEPSWSESLDAAFNLTKSYTTLTATSSTTHQKIFMCSWAVLHIARLIAQLNTSCPPFYAAASSSLTALKEYIGYARQTSSDLFGEASGVRGWMDFIRQAEQASNTLGDIRVECFGTVLPITESLRGHPAPRRKTGEGITGGVAPCLAASGRGTERAGETRGQDCVIPVVGVTLKANTGGNHVECDYIPVVAGYMQERDAKGADSDTKPGHLIAVNSGQGFWRESDHAGAPGTEARAVHENNLVMERKVQNGNADETDARKILLLLREAYGAKAYEQWRDSILTSFQPSEVLRQALHGALLDAEGLTGNDDSQRKVEGAEAQGCGAVRSVRRSGRAGRSPQGPEHEQQRVGQPSEDLPFMSQPDSPEGRDMQGVWQTEQGSRILRETLSAIQEVRRSAHVQTQPAYPAMQVRRLTPKEAERLQGFPDGWTKGFSDSARYRMLGNAVAVPVAQWIAARLAKSITGRIEETQF